MHSRQESVRCRTDAVRCSLGGICGAVYSFTFKRVSIATTTRNLRARSRASADQLMAGGAAVITDYEARDVHRFEIRQRKTCEAAKIVIVPASVGSADQASACAVVGQDDSVISKRSDDDRRLRTRGGAGGSRRRSLQSVNLTGRSRHAAAGGRRRLRDLALHRD